MGKLACLADAEGDNWVFHLLSNLYSLIAYTLAENKKLLMESLEEFCNILLLIQTRASFTSCKDLAWHTSFAMKQAARLTHHTSYQYNINRTMRAKIKFFCDKLKPGSDIEWEMPIAHLIPWTPFATSIDNSPLEGASGFSIVLGFWWHICFPDKIIQRTLRFKSDNKDGLLVSINVLEFVTVIINYCAALHIFQTSNLTEGPHPVQLNITNNASTLSCTLHNCKRSRIGRLLAHFFCSLLINSPLGINLQWISTDNNKIANDISCLKKQSDTNSAPNFDYTTLKQTYPELNHCSFFQIQPKLISIIWAIVSTKKWPSHEEVQTLKQRLLGKLIT